jgi:hypothetical protein
VAINSSLGVQEIIQLTADAARSVIGAQRASVAVLASSSRCARSRRRLPSSSGRAWRTGSG